MITHITPRETELARQIDEQGGKIEYWRDRAIAAEKDAARYRWLSCDFYPIGLSIDNNHKWEYGGNCSLKGPSLDAAIDEALKGTP